MCVRVCVCVCVCVCVRVRCRVILCGLSVLLSLRHHRSTWGSFENLRRNKKTKAFPRTLSDFISQKQWERHDVETEERKIRTAVSRKRREERYAKRHGIDPKKHVKRLFRNNAHGSQSLAALPHYTPPKTIRMTRTHVAPITSLKYVMKVFQVLVAA